MSYIVLCSIAWHFKHPCPYFFHVFILHFCIFVKLRFNWHAALFKFSSFPLSSFFAHTITSHNINLECWTLNVSLCRSDRLLEQCSIALVGKYTKFSDSYASVIKALEHSALSISHKLEVKVRLSCGPVITHCQWVFSDSELNKTFLLGRETSFGCWFRFSTSSLGQDAFCFLWVLYWSPPSLTPSVFHPSLDLFSLIVLRRGNYTHLPTTSVGHWGWLKPTRCSCAWQDVDCGGNRDQLRKLKLGLWSE